MIVAACACAASAAWAAPAEAAITFRSAASATTAIPALSMSVPAPSGIAVGDLLLASASVRSATFSATAAGWNVKLDTGGTNMRQVTLWRIADSSDTSAANYTFNFPGAARATVGISDYTGVDTANPVGAAVGAADAASGTSATPPQITTSYLRAAVVVATSWTTAGTTVTEGAGTVERYEAAAANNSTLESADYTQASAAATTPNAVTGSASSHWVAQTIELNEMPALTASFPSDYAWPALTAGSTATSSEQTINVTSNRSWGVQIASDRSNGRSTEWTGSAYGALAMTNPLQWRTSSVGGAGQATSFANLTGSGATAVTGQAASASAVAVGLTFRQQVSYADEAALPAGHTYRQNVSYTAQQGF